MDMHEIATELDKFSQANGLNVNVEAVLKNMDAGDFVELNHAMDKSDNRTIIKILQKYKARMSENFKKFKDTKIIEGYTLDLLTPDELNKLYKETCSFSLQDNSHLTLAEMKTLIFDTLNEDLTSSLTTNQLVKQNTATQQGQVNPQTQTKLKQADLQRNSTNSNYKVTVPGDTAGSTELANVVGVDIGSTPDRTLVVTKDPSKPNQVNVFGINDVQTVDEEEEIEVLPEPEVDDVDIEKEEPDEEDDVISQIMKFCNYFKEKDANC